MDKTLLEILNALGKKRHVNKKNIVSAVKRIEKDPKHIIRSNNPIDHFCVFFLPYHKNSNSIYLVHHKKAKDWIPPGGHIEKGEFPELTVFREMQEELSYCPTAKQMELFYIDNKRLKNIEQVCKIHWHLWYIVHFSHRIEFMWDNREFYDAGWFGLKEGLVKIKNNDGYKDVIKKLLYQASQTKTNSL